MSEKKDTYGIDQLKTAIDLPLEGFNVISEYKPDDSQVVKAAKLTRLLDEIFAMSGVSTQGLIREWKDLDQDETNALITHGMNKAGVTDPRMVEIIKRCIVTTNKGLEVVSEMVQIGKDIEALKKPAA